jgi:hypothetical protein
MDFNTSADAEDALLLSASSSPFVAATRADADEIDYRIYVVHQPERAWTADTNFIAADGFVPTASGILGTTATTGGYVTGDNLPTRFHQKTLSFYGLTLSNNQDPAEVADSVKFSEDGTPCYHFSYNSAPLPDIRVGYIQTDITGTTNGVVDLPFKHALAKLEIYISHAEYQYDDNGDAHTWNDQYTISQCEIQGPQGGTIDLNYLTNHSTWSTDLWTPDETTTTLSTLAGEKTFSTTLVPLTDEENGFLIFPCHSFRLIIKEKNEGAPHELIVEPGNSENFDFEPNHLYRIYLQYTQKGSFIVTVHPDYYDYITEEATTLSIGNPTLFNGVVWADRNIGATSSTYNNIEEWEEMRGYFYQMGRNIPYKTYPLLQYAADDPNAADANHTCHEFVRADGSKYYWVQSSGDADDYAGNAEPHLKDKGRYLYPYIPGLWETVPAQWGYASFTLRKGKSSYYDYATTSKLTWYKTDSTTQATSITDRVMIKSTDNRNMFLYLTIPDTIPSGTFLTPWYMKRFLVVANTNSTWKEATSSKLWENNITPCPPGWRIPNDTEWKGIVPVTTLTGDITYFHNILNYPNDASNRHTYEGDYCWYETSDNDPISNTESIYYGNMPQGKTGTQTKECGDIYVIKYYGSSSAYGLHIWVDKSLTATKNTAQPQLDDRPDYDEKSVEARSVLYIDRYTFSQSPAKATFNQENPPQIDENGMVYTYDNNNTADTTRQKIYWYKVETLTFPICGVGHYNFCTLIWSGTEAQYASSSGHFVRMKIGGSCGTANLSRFVFLDVKATKTSVIPIRPVRDETAISW